MIRSFFAIFAFILSVSPAAALADAIRWRLEPGQVLRYEYNRETLTGISVVDIKTQRDVHRVFRWTWTVEKVAADGRAHVRVVFDRVRYRQKTGDRVTLFYDSRSPEEADERSLQVLGPFASLAGKGFTLDLLPDGKVENLDGLDELMDAAPWPEIAEAPLAKARADTVKDLTDDGMGKALGRLLGYLPPPDTALGASWGQEWTREQGQDSPISAMRQGFTLEALSVLYAGANCAKFSRTAEIEQPDVDFDTAPSFVRLLGSKGQMFFDMEAHAHHASANMSAMQIKSTAKAERGVLKGSDVVTRMEVLDVELFNRLPEKPPEEIQTPEAPK